jgi:hypothetical protein
MLFQLRMLMLYAICNVNVRLFMLRLPAYILE